MDRVGLQYFIAVVEQRSFTRAAVALHVSQSTLSKSIRALEGELGVRLLDRGSRGTRPTEAGLAVHARAREILDGFDSLAYDARRTHSAARERIRIAFTATLTSAPCAEFMARLLTEDPDLDATSWGVESVEFAMQVVERGDCDVAVVGSRTRPTAKAGLRVESLYEDNLVVLARAGSVLDGLARVGVGDLAEQRFIAEPRGGLLRELVDELCRHGARIIAELFTRQVLVQLVRAGAGAALVPRQFALGEQLEGLILRQLDPEISVGIWLLTREITSEPVQRFRRIALESETCRQRH